MYVGLHVKYPLHFLDINQTWFFSIDFFKILEYEILRKPVQWEPSCSMRTRGQTEMTKLIVAFASFSNVPKSNRIYFLVKNFTRNTAF